MAKTLTGSDHLYLQVANGLEKMIHEETLRIGDKLPSVRMLSEEYGISMGTAFQAYYHLEGKGLIEARPKSGYYVRFNRKRITAMSAIPDAAPIAQETNVSDLISSVYRNIAAKDIVNLSVAAPAVELLPSAKLNKSMIHAIRSTPDSCTSYENIQGNDELRKQIARLCFNWKGRISSNDIVVTSGCMEAMVMCLKAVTAPGDTVAIESPTYFGIFQVIESLGLKVVEMVTDPVDGVDPEMLEQVIKKYSIKACVLVTSFSNPSGSCIPDKNKKAIVDIITKHRVPLIEDDIYGELYFAASRPATCKTFDKEGWVLHCSSFSKSLAPGYRIGYAIAGRFTQEVLRLKLMHTVSGTRITQVALAHFLSIGRFDYHLKNLRRSLYTQHLRYIQALIEFFPSDITISNPQGGFVLWVGLNKKVNAINLYNKALQHQISIAPGHIFSARSTYSNYLRIGYGKPFDESIERSFRILGSLVKKMY